MILVLILWLMLLAYGAGWSVRDAQADREWNREHNIQ